ncbi:MAG: TraR/DksA family transcriptional regulator [Alphaproteobacteria bacterium]|nr:MAG: TraR/DksA family transcriptional regulator [Alphaproteobacteria bacterium]
MANRAEALDLTALKDRLLRERSALLSRREAHRDDGKPVELDQQSVGRLSRMDAMQVQAMARESDRRRATRLMQIDAALQRIEDGEFGYCVACGEEIAPKRLLHDPAIPTCVACAGR